MPVRAGPLTAEIQRRIQALEMRCWTSTKSMWWTRRFEEVCNRIQNVVGVHDDLLTMVKKRKLYGMATSQDLWHGENNSVGDSERSKKERKTEEETGRWTGMGIGDSLRAAEDREGWKGTVATSSVVPRQSPRLRDWEMREKVIRYLVCGSHSSLGKGI